MKKIENILSEQLLQECIDSTKEKLQTRYCWGVDIFNWSNELKKGTTGMCLFSLAKDDLARKIESEIKHHLPDYQGLMVQHYIWTQGSGIARHNDGNYKFGLTIYLNEKWDIDYGGIFLWKEKDAEKYHVICPELNAGVLNDDGTFHMVTPIAFDAPELRVTIQIWGM